MKKHLLSIFFMAAAFLAKAQEAKNFVIPVKVDANEEQAAITLSWPLNPNAISYTIRRKQITDQSYATTFRTIADIIDSADTCYKYVDKSIVTGVMYEYEITGKFNTILPALRTTYVCAGIKIPEVHSRGTVILLCDNTISTALAPELKKLYEDLVGDGWKIRQINVARSDDPHDVPLVKNSIINAYQQAPDTKYIFIIGHVPVPYSGLITPDGHGNHYGAWAADGYYGDMQNVWTDATANDISAARPENRNIPGDGKFDQSNFTSVQLGVGRIDFSKLPAFTLPEADLLRRYLAKDHLYKMAGITINKKALIEDNFSGYSEQFSQAGWKSGAANVGYDNVARGGYDTVLTTNTGSSYLWSYGCGAGVYNGAWGIASTADFATRTYNTVFTSIFGSYFGDWDSQDNLMRAALASAGSILTCVWSGRPNWFFHHMSIGYPIGYSALLAMNNTGIYTNTGSNAARVHTSLLGDPTLRSSYIKPPAALTKNVAGTSIHLTWQSTIPERIQGYNIYRGNSITGGFSLLNDVTIKDNFFDDTIPLTGKNVYLLRTVLLDTVVTSGLYINNSTYYNMSQAVVDSVFFGNVVLPVNLISFSARANNCKAELSWKTSAETDIQSYTIEYSQSGSDFRAVGSISATASLNTDGTRNYRFLHTAAQESAFYRLKITGSDGSIQYSQQVFLAANCSDNEVQVYPVPAEDFLYIKVSVPSMMAESYAVLTDIAGKRLQKISIVNGINRLPMSSMPGGIYNLALTMNGAVKNYKVIK